MSDPPRIDRGPAGKLLRAGRSDRMPARAIRQTVATSFAALGTSAAVRAAALTKLGFVAVSGGAIALAAHAIVTRPAHVESASNAVESAHVVPVVTGSASAKVIASGSASAPPIPTAPIASTEEAPPQLAPAPPSGRPRATTPAASVVRKAAPRADELAREIDLLGRARAQIAAGTPESAAALLDEYERTVDDKQLHEEASELRGRVKALRAPSP